MSIQEKFAQKMRARSPYYSTFWLNEQQQNNPGWSPLHDRMWRIENEQTPPPAPMDNFYRNERQQRDPNYPVPDDPLMDREMELLKESRFDDSRAYQVADASGAFSLDEPAPSVDQLAEMGGRVGIDPKTLRGLDLNATEARNFGYLLRMMEAENEIRRLQGSNTLGQRMLELLPGQDIEALFMDPEYRRYMLARENFNEAALRAATGATINQQEMPMQRRNYFPLPTDDAETRALLERQRQALMMALTAGSGAAASVIPDYGEAVVPQQSGQGISQEDQDFLRSLGIN